MCEPGFLRLLELVAVVLVLSGVVAQAEVLTSALEVRSLTFEKADSGVPVDLTGTVIFTDSPGTVFVQDETAATFFQLKGRTPPAPGDSVRVRGRSFPGLYLPGIEEAEFEVVKSGLLPTPIEARFDDLQSGRFHYQRVAISGIVRTVVPEGEGTTLMRVALGSRVVEVKVESVAVDPEKWVGARVKVSGLAAGDLNHRRQLVRPFLRCSGWEEVRLITPAQPLEELPAVTPDEVMTFAVGGQELNRVSVTGVVTASLSRLEVFLRSNEAGIAVRLMQGEPRLEAGEIVTLAGFPEMERYTATLVDSILVAYGDRVEPPSPLRIAPAEFQAGGYDSELVSFEAELSDWYRSEGGYRLVLAGDGELIQAASPEISEDMVRGATVAVTGIGFVQKAGRSGQYRSAPEEVTLRLRSAEDMRLLQAPGWWTAQRLGIALVAVLVAIALALSWIFLLRRQVSKQTLALRSKIEYEAVLEERQRIAREFHDSLEQDLAGLTLRLDAAGAGVGNEKVSGLIEGSRGLVKRIQNETRNLVVDLREAPGETASLMDALEELGSSVASGEGPNISLTSDFKNGALLFRSRVVHHLKMMVQESLTNVLKHASAETVEIGLKDKGGVLILTIDDDGSGFDFESETRGKSGHFGCMGMRERARKIGAEINWSPSRSGGTRVEIRIPLSQIDVA